MSPNLIACLAGWLVRWQVRSWVSSHLSELSAMVDDSPSYSTGSSW